jgi:hypothetical protein
VVAGALLAGAQVVSRSQPIEALAAAPVASPAVAGPAPSSVVNIDSFSFASSQNFGEVTISAVDPLVLFEVPAGRWLLITDCEISGGPFFDLVEIAGPTLTTKRGSQFTILPAYHSSVGLAFAPGTKLAIRNSAGSEQIGAFTLTGYLTRE